MGEATAVTMTSQGEYEHDAGWAYTPENEDDWEAFSGTAEGYHRLFSVWYNRDDACWRCSVVVGEFSELQMRLLLLKTPEEAYTWASRERGS